MSAIKNISINVSSILTRRNDQSEAHYFARMFAIAAAPTLMLALVAALLVDSSPKFSLDPGSGSLFGWQILTSVFIQPIIETFILLWPTALAYDALEKKPRAALIGILPIVMLHGFSHWLKPTTVAWTFFVQAYAYLELRTTGTSFRSSIAFVGVFHILWNFLLALALVVIRWQ